MKKIIPIVALALPVFAGDPGGYQGFVKAVFTGQAIDITSDVFANAESRVITPVGLYTTALESKTTIAYGGYMKMEGGVIYQFKGCFDDRVAVKIESTWVLSNGSDCQERTGSYTPSATDWYKIDLRVANNGGAGGCQDASHYGILWKKSDETDWHRFDYDLSLFKTGTMSTQLRVEPCALPQIVSSKMRANDPTVMDVVYKVISDKPTVNVRALAFEDGERSFWKVVRPETFVKDANGNETAQNIGDGIAANVEHKLSWKVSADWKTDLAKVKFEVLTSEMAQLPLKTVTIPAAGKTPVVKVYGNSQTAANCFNALLWHYADSAQDLQIDDGYLYWNRSNGARTLLSNRTAVGEVATAVTYIYLKMGLEPLSGALQAFVHDALRKYVWFNSSGHWAVKTTERPASLYMGEKAYWWIDLTTGESGYLDSVPLAGWDDEYKTTKLLMRRIEPGDVTMGGTKPVTISEPFYIGVFEVTQKQYELINGSNPSSYKGDMRPVEYVSYNDIRGTNKGAQWPNGTEFDDTSWLGKLRAKVGVAFDLPTESQWEYACRAGTTTYFNNGGSSAIDLSLVGRCDNNRTDGKGGYSEHTTVGSYLPNAWGLYDMHGNVFEWCLDWYGSINSDPATDWAGAASGSGRVLRGGNWYLVNSFCRSSSRGNYAPSSRDSIFGFRLCCSAPAGLQ